MSKEDEVLDKYLLKHFSEKEVDFAKYEKYNYVDLLNKEMDNLIDDYAKRRIAELEEQLKNAIVPRFKVGQEIWEITPLMSWKIKRIEWHKFNGGNGDGSCCGDYRFYYEKPKIETEMDKMHEWDLDRWARNVENKSLDKLGKFEDFMEEQGFEDLQSLKDTLYQTNMELYSMIKLQKENQALKDKWQKLKEWALYLCYFELVDKMEELEKEIK